MNKYQVSNDSKIEVYYLFRCDDKNRPIGMSPDVSYPLSEYEKVMALADELNTKGINYDLLVERFDSSTDEVLSNDYIVANNFKN
jgi:hypothetical protein